MTPRIASAMACLLAAAPLPVASFAPTSLLSQQHASSSALRMASSQHASEDMYPQLLNNASLCAHNEECSIESAELYLKEIVHVQSGCAAGTLSGSNVCNDVLGVSEVVADLRQKIGQGAKADFGTFWNNAALYAAAIIVVSALQTATMDPSAGVVPFTPQEVWWAVRDGYVPDLASHLFRNGGLLVDDAVATVGSSLSPQELLWSIRDGYATDTMFSNGGGGVESVPFTPQEAWWAVKDGYATDMVGHWLRNGGLSM